MSSVIDLCNLALGNIRESSINSLTEQSIAAQVCNQRYERSVKYVLRAFPWNFAQRTTALALYSEEPKEWLYAYTYPSDGLRIHRIVPNYLTSADRTIDLRFDDEGYNRLRQLEKHRIPFEISRLSTGDPAILTDQVEAYVNYTVHEKDPNRYDSMFEDALSWYLSSMIAVAIVGSEKGRELRADALTIYKEVINDAQVTNANERRNENKPESPTITARR